MRSSCASHERRRVRRAERVGACSRVASLCVIGMLRAYATAAGRAYARTLYSRPAACGPRVSAALPCGVRALSSAPQPEAPSSAPPLPAAADAASSPQELPQSPPQPPPPAWVTFINSALESHGMETAVMFVALDVASVTTMYAALGAAGVTPDADFALAFALARLVRRVRLPFDIAVAAALARAFPSLAQVKISQLLFKRAPAEPGAPPATGLRRLAEGFGSMLDKYGLAFTTSQRMVGGLATVAGFYAAITHGVDVQGTLEGWGLPIGEVGKIAGQWAGAVCLAAVFYPGTVLGAAAMGRGIGRFRKRRAGLE